MASSESAVDEFKLCWELAGLIHHGQPEKSAARIAVLQKFRDKWAADQEVVVTTPNNRYGKRNETPAHQALSGGSHNRKLFVDLSESPQRSAQELCIGSDSEDSTHRRNQLKHTEIQTEGTDIVPASDLQRSANEDGSFGDSRARGSDTGGRPSVDPGHNKAENPCGSVRNLPKGHSIRKQHVCDTCEKKFKTSSHLKTHQQIHTGVKPYHCILCKREFTRSSHLRCHWQKIHKLEVLHCTYCKKTFYDPDKRRHHEQNDRPEQVLVLDGEDMNQYACDKCEESFPNFRELQTHYKLHISKSLHRCLHCSEFFATKSSLYKHAASLPTRTQFVCPECGKHYFFYKNLEGHIETNHSEGQSKPVVSERDSAQSCDPTQLMSTGDAQEDQIGKTYLCHQHEKAFTRQDSLARQGETHTNKKRHGCNKCSKTYVQKYSLLRHNERQHKPFICATCQEFFNGKAALNKHAFDHRRSEKQTGDAGSSATGDSLGHNESNYSDHKDINDRSSATRKEITTPKINPKGVKEHKCRYCGKILRKRSHLIEHERIHTGEKPFTCDVCKRPFKRKSALNSHQLTQHGLTANPRTAHTVGHSTDHLVLSQVKTLKMQSPC